MTSTRIDSPQALGQFIKKRRRQLKLRQPDLALTANVGIRFIVEVERGKETAQIGLVFRVLDALGIALDGTYAPWTEADSPENHSVTDE